MTPATKKMENTVRNLIMTDPWYGLMLRHFERVEVDRENMPTIVVIATGQGADVRMRLEYNAKFLLSLSDQEAAEVMKHEVLHPTFSHLRRETQGTRWNVAQDLAINSLLNQDALKGVVDRIGGCLAGHGDFKDMPVGKSAEWYHAQLPEGVEDGYGGFDEHGQLSADAHRKLKEIIKQTTDHVSQMNQWGNVSAEVRAAINNYLQGYDWRAELERVVSRTRDLEITTTRRKINKRLPHSPGAVRKRVPKILVAIDESGSVGPELWTMLASALASLSLHANFDLLPFDRNVAEGRLQTFKKGRAASFGRSLAGGTDFSAPTAFLNEHAKTYDVLFVATDGEAERPIDCDKRRVWILPEGRKLMFETEERVIYVR